MGLRFYRRIPLIPGVRLNATTRGLSVSVGHRGAWYTVGANGRRTATLGWPGTGLRYTASRGGGAPRQALPRAPSAIIGTRVAYPHRPGRANLGEVRGLVCALEHTG